MRKTGRIRRPIVLIGGAILFWLMPTRVVATISSLQQAPPSPTCMDVIDLNVAGFFEDTCWLVERIDLTQDAGRFLLNIRAVDRWAPGIVCAQIFVNYSGTRRIGRLPPGSYLVRAQESFTSNRINPPPVPREITLNVSGGINDVDMDGDGLSACQGDCDDANANAWSEPGEASNLELLADASTLRWVPPAESGGTTPLVFDTLRSNAAGDFVNNAACLESGDGSDLVSTDPQAPVPGSTFFYLVRAVNSCPGSAAGGLGSNTSGIPRSGRTCP